MNRSGRRPSRQATVRFLSAWLWGIPVVLLLVLGGCQGKPAKLTTTDGQHLAWEDMDISQRKRHMQQAVLPVAVSVFSSWRPERFASVDCTLCHGKGVREERFDMPTNHLPRLSGALFLGPEFSAHPETTRLKLNELVPRMADALGKKPFSLLTRRGFGCYSCHLGPNGAMYGN
jgi:hypothetical protein